MTQTDFAEKRAYARKVANTPVHVAVLPEAESISPHIIDFDCLTRDLSPEGLRLHGKEGLKKDSLVHLKVAFEDSEQPLTLMGKVVWSTETTEHEHICGLHLTDAPNTDFDLWQARFEMD
jgi:hypothetical protein